MTIAEELRGANNPTLIRLGNMLDRLSEDMQEMLVDNFADTVEQVDEDD